MNNQSQNKACSNLNTRLHRFLQRNTNALQLDVPPDEETKCTSSISNCYAKRRHTPMLHKLAKLYYKNRAGNKNKHNHRQRIRHLSYRNTKHKTLPDICDQISAEISIPAFPARERARDSCMCTCCRGVVASPQQHEHANDSLSRV